MSGRPVKSESGAEILDDLSRRGVHVWAEGDRLRYRAPKGSIPAELLVKLTHRKADIMALLSDRIPRLDAGPGGDLLSFAQERLWFLAQLLPGNPLYNVANAVRLRGSLQREALEAALNDTIRRHETLRTTFHWRENRPTQVMMGAEQARLPLPVVDLQYVAPDERERRARDLAGIEARKPFDLTQAPLLRATVFRLAADDHVLLLNSHHIISDGWSMSEVLLREIAALYEARVTGTSPALSEPAIRYADFAAWQRSRFHGSALDTPLSYWRRQLADVPVLTLPTDSPRPQVQGFRGAKHPVAFDRHLVEALEAVGRERHATLFMTMLAAFNVLLSRHAGQTDVVVGCPIANRSRPELESLVGFFVNTVALRTDLSGDPGFLELLTRLRQAVLDAFRHQDVPFEKLVQELHLQRDLGRSALFQVVFDLQKAPQFPSCGGLSIAPWDFDSGTVRFDLELHLWKGAGGLTGFIEFDTDLFTGPAIARLSGHFQTLLASIVSDPRSPVSSLRLLTDAERRQVLVDWNSG